MSRVYGPVPSRRLGQSLGVDPVPFKACNYNCVYCQLGRTTRQTVERSDDPPAEEILSEIRVALEKHEDGTVELYDHGADPAETRNVAGARPDVVAPAFNDAPDPLSGISRWASDTWRSTEGRTVSMRVYIGTVIGVVVLMMLARCGG